MDPWVRKTAEEGNGYPLQYSCLGNPVDRGAWRLQSIGLQKRHNVATKQQMGILMHIPIAPASPLLDTNSRGIGTRKHEKALAKMFIAMMFALEMTLGKKNVT